MSGVPGRLAPPADGRRAATPASGSDTLFGCWPDRPRQERASAAEAAGPDSPGDWHAALARALRLGLLGRGREWTEA